MSKLPRKEEYIAKYGEKCYEARAGKRHRYYESVKDKYEERYRDNAEELKAKAKAYRDAHKAEISERRKEAYRRKKEAMQAKAA